MSYRDLNSRWYHVSAIVVSCILVSIVMSVIGAAYTHAQVKESERREAAIKHDSDHRWCALLVQLDTTLPDTANIKTTIHNLRIHFGCDNVDAPSSTYFSPTPARK